MSTTSIFYPDSATRVSYCLIILSVLVPIGLASSSWVGMTVGSGPFGWFTGLPMLPLFVLGLYRVYLVVRSKEVLCAPDVGGFPRLARKFGVFLIHIGGLVAVLGFLAGPLMHALVKHKTESGAEFFVVGVYLAMAGRVGWSGLFLFEASRLMSFERHFRQRKQVPAATAKSDAGDFRDTHPMAPN